MHADNYRHRQVLQHYALSPVTAPATEPVTLTQVKAYCNIEAGNTYWDTMLGLLIQAGREEAEKFMGRRLVTSTWDLIFDRLPYPYGEIVIPYGPLQSVTSIYYLDINNNSTLFPSSLYTVDTASFAGSVYPDYTQFWPMQIWTTGRWIRNGVTIRHVSGYGTAAQVPAEIQLAICQFVATKYAYREALTAGLKIDKVPGSIATLLSKERQSWL